MCVCVCVWGGGGGGGGGLQYSKLLQATEAWMSSSLMGHMADKYKLDPLTPRSDSLFIISLARVCPLENVPLWYDMRGGSLHISLTERSLSNKMPGCSWALVAGYRMIIFRCKSKIFFCSLCFCWSASQIPVLRLSLPLSTLSLEGVPDLIFDSLQTVSKKS